MDTPFARTFPGLAKIRAAPLVQRRRVDLCTAQAGRWREILDGADVVSEGRAIPDGGALVYYGSSSVLLPQRSAGGSLPDRDVAALAALLRLDPHVRLRALRIAHREASTRAGGPIGTLRAEISVAAGARGVLITIEVVARLARGQLRASGGLPR